MKNEKGETITLKDLKDGESFYFGGSDSFKTMTVNVPISYYVDIKGDLQYGDYELGYDFLKALEEL